ncbi:NAD(P)-binding protein [Stipitochalara longipes BDJ]|nr:NAD(P)-binding protein [Stipitochalara longipes BDJ]
MSSSPRIFVTGVSGYVGGNMMGRLLEKHPEWHVVVLVRNEKQKEIVLARWPQLEVVIGDLDNSALMIQEGSKADVVLQTASSDHVLGVVSLIQGLSQRQPTPGYLIHIGGTGILHDTQNGFGQQSDKIYHDTTDLVEITSFPVEGHVHRDVDIAILEAQKKLHVPTAIVTPPQIHGVGKGPVKTRSIQIPTLIEATLKRGKGFQILEGQNIWDHVHVDDLSDAFILLVEEALKPSGGSAQWGDEGYYFAEAGEFKWGEISASISKIMVDQELIKTADIDKLSVAEAATLHPWAPLIWGGNARSRSDRFHSLGWKPHGPSLLESLPLMIAEEVKTSGTQSAKLTFDK